MIRYAKEKIDAMIIPRNQRRVGLEALVFATSCIIDAFSLLHIFATPKLSMLPEMLSDATLKPINLIVPKL